MYGNICDKNERQKIKLQKNVCIHRFHGIYKNAVTIQANEYKLVSEFMPSNARLQAIGK